MHIKRIVLTILILVVLSVSVVPTVFGIDNSALITQAMRDLGTNCANLALNTTCLGNGSVERVTSAGLISSTYTQPGARASINTTHEIRTGALDASTGEFGVNLMRVQAGLPSSSQGVVYASFGGTTLTNLGGAGQAVWQNISVSIASDSPMPFLFVQGPKNQPATITVNGKVIEIHSTIVIWFSDGNMQVTVLSGSILGDQSTAQVCETIKAAIQNGVAGIFGAAVGGLFPTGIVYVGLLPGNVINYPVSAPTFTTPSGIGGTVATCSLS